MFSEGYRTHRDVTGPMNFKKRTFFQKIVLPGFWEPGCHSCTLIDLVHTALASKYSVETICMISQGYRTHRGVTGPMNLKKSGGFSGKSCTRDFGATVCHPSNLIDFSNTALAIKSLLKTICMISEGYTTHRVVTGPMSFKKSGRFSRKIVLPGILGTWLSSKHCN